MVVDNAIVVVDNVYRRLERKEKPREAAIFGTSEGFKVGAPSFEPNQSSEISDDEFPF